MLSKLAMSKNQTNSKIKSVYKAILLPALSSLSTEIKFADAERDFE